MIHYQNNQDFAVVGTAKEQQGFGLYFKSFTQETFTPQAIGLLSTNKSPFYAFVNTNKSISVNVDGKTVTLSNKQQGFIATYRFATFKKHKQLLSELESGALTVLTEEQTSLLLPKVKDLSFDFRNFVRNQRCTAKD